MARLNLKWIEANANIHGKGWDIPAAPFIRLPAKAELLVPTDVWTLSLLSAGLFTCFETDSSVIHVSWELGLDKLAHPHMPSTSVSGLDLYGQDLNGAWNWVGIVYPDKPGLNSKIIAYGLQPGKRKYIIYLPLLNRIKSLSIGVENAAHFEFCALSSKKPIVYYGTSIVHGIAASRAGNCHTAILGRRLNVNIVNLGFSGRGKMEKILAELISEIDAQLYIIDCLPNMEEELVSERAGTFLNTLCGHKPTTPVLLVEDRSYSNTWVIPALRKRNELSRAALRKAYLNIKSQEKYPIYYKEGESLLGGVSGATVDGSHPNDLGFSILADSLEDSVRSIING